VTSRRKRTMSSFSGCQVLRKSLRARAVCPRPPSCPNEIREIDHRLDSNLLQRAHSLRGRLCASIEVCADAVQVGQTRLLDLRRRCWIACAKAPCARLSGNPIPVHGHPRPRDSSTCRRDLLAACSASASRCFTISGFCARHVGRFAHVVCRS
jgi:hypothetical protein